MDQNKKQDQLKRIEAKIRRLIAEYHDIKFEDEEFVPGVSRIDPSGKIVGVKELEHGVQAVLDGRWAEGEFAKAFKEKLGAYLNTRYVHLTNSGSSANLAALYSLTSQEWGERRLQPGDEVICAATAFPTTVNPVVQAGLVPVFIDSMPVESGHYNPDCSRLEEAVSEKTKAIFFAHTLGNPFDVRKVLEIAKAKQLWVIEDCCDALGSTWEGRRVGTFGALGTLSFYPAHHITMGEGGAVFTQDGKLSRVVKSFINWGRHCWCDPGFDSTCGKRFGWKLGDLPEGYDHKNTYYHLGFNLKATDMQAAIGLGQLEQLDGFVLRRKENFKYLYERLRKYDDKIILPQHFPEADPSWFGFLMTVREGAGFTRKDAVTYLGERNIQTRDLFAGNMTRQPSFKGVPYRVVGGLENSDEIVERTFWIGVQPNITDEVREYVADTFDRFFAMKYKQGV